MHGLVWKAERSCALLHRLVFRRRKPRERAVLLGCTIGSTAQALPLAFSQAALGAVGLQCALLLSIVNSIAGQADWLCTVH